MRIEDLKNIQDAPKTGNALIYTREKVEYISYSDINAIISTYKNNQRELLEIHLFDEEKEYRAIVSESPRFEGQIEYVVSDEKHLEDKKFEEITITDSNKKLKVINYIKFDQNGMSKIVDYRLVAM